jgi:hypothetical protein
MHSNHGKVYYLPYQVVVKESSTTTKLHVMFDVQQSPQMKSL